MASADSVFHAPLLASVDTCDFLGVVTTSPERRALVAAEHPGVSTFDSLEALVAAGAEAVTISTPADTHSRLTDEALALGLHVVCDKPFALDAAAAARSVELATERGLVLSPYQNRRWDSDFLTLRGLVDRGRLGSVVRMESRFERFVPDRVPKPAGGGTLLDFGSHLIDQALVLLGPVNAVYAEWTIRDERPRRRRVRRAHPRERCTVAPLGELAAAGAGAALPRRRHRGGVRRRRADGRTGGVARRRRHAAVTR